MKFDAKKSISYLILCVALYEAGLVLLTYWINSVFFAIALLILSLFFAVTIGCICASKLDSETKHKDKYSVISL